MAEPSADMSFQLSRVRCRVHPSVILTMLDAHGRLKGSHDYAIGTLLGTVSTEGVSRGAVSGSKVGGVVVEVVDCFANPYQWDAVSLSLTITKDQHEWMMRLREKIYPKLVVVGWCCTTSAVVSATALSDWACQEAKVSRFVPSKALPEPIHILIDTSFSAGPSILKHAKAYIRGPLRQLFHEIPLDIGYGSSEAAGMTSIIKKSSHQLVTTSPASHTGLKASLKQLTVLIQAALAYIDQVLAGKRSGDPALGRALMRVVYLENLLLPNETDNLCEKTFEDNLMIGNLASLVKLQFSIAERLNTTLAEC